MWLVLIEQTNGEKRWELMESVQYHKTLSKNNNFMLLWAGFVSDRNRARLMAGMLEMADT